MLRFFQKAYLSQYIVLFLLTILFWTPSVILKSGYTSESTPAFELILRAGMLNPFILNGIALITILLTGLFMNNLAGDFGFSRKLSTTTMFLFLLFASSLTSFTTLSPFLLINVFLLFFIRSIFILPDSEDSIPLIFNASLILGIASFFYLPVIIFVVLIWFSLIIHRSNAWRNYTASFAGIILPHILMMTWYFWNDDLESYFIPWTDFLNISTNFTHLTISIDLIIIVIYLALLIIAAFGIMAHLTEKNISLRRNLIITLYYFVFTLIIILFFSVNLTSAMLILIPGTLILTRFLADIKHVKFFNTSFLIITILILINQYYRLIDALLIAVD